MNAALHTPSEPREIGRLLAAYWERGLVVMLLVAAAATAYACLSPKTWQATQALIVRNEAAASGDNSLGKFHGTDEMKGVQETIQELARSRTVLEDTLREVGKASDEPAGPAADGNWPTARNVEALRQSVTITPPKGAAFGATEIFYLDVRDHDRQRAVALNRAICERLRVKFQDLRDAKAQSMIDELDKTVRLSQADLRESTDRLLAMEKSVGSDLAELRMLRDGSAGDGMIRRKLTEIEAELRQVRAAEKSSQQLLDMLRPAVSDPTALLASPNRLLESQPALKRLKDGLVDAQLRTAQLQGQMSSAHPLVLGAKEAERETALRLHDEVAIAVRGLEAELHFNADRAAMLEKQRNDASARLCRLGAIRADYSNQVAENNQRTKLVERAEDNLAEARATRASARAASMINAIDTPDTGARPVSPGATVVILAGVLGGLLTGLAVIFLSPPPATRARVAEPEFANSPTAQDWLAPPLETRRPVAEPEFATVAAAQDLPEPAREAQAPVAEPVAANAEPEFATVAAARDLPEPAEKPRKAGNTKTDLSDLAACIASDRLGADAAPSPAPPPRKRNLSVLEALRRVSPWNHA